MTSPSSIDLIKRLVAFDTTSHLSNLELITHVSDYLAGFGVESGLVHNEAKTKANLYATIGPADKPGVMLSGHTDVVPVKGQHWDSDPFDVLAKDGRLYGRGTADMKGFIAIVLSRIAKMQSADLRTPIHLALSYDEEIGCIGVRQLLNVMEGLAVKPAMCIIGEPTNMSVAIAHKGKLAARVHVKGLESHSSLPCYGVNAIEYAAELIGYIRRLARQLSENGPFDHNFQTPYSTLQTGVIRGGSAVNIVPNSCRFDFEIRNIPQQNIQDLYQQIVDFAEHKLTPMMQEIDAESGIDFELLSDYPGLFTAPDEPVVEFVKSLAETDRAGTIDFGTEGGLFSRQLGIPTVVCGPGRIEQAHKPNEFIEISQIKKAESFVDKLIAALANR